MSRERYYTKEQEEYRNKILRRNNKSVIISPIVEQKLIYDTTCMKNCIFWFDRYLYGNCDKERFDYAMYAMETHIKDLKRFITQQTPNESDRN